MSENPDFAAAFQETLEDLKKPETSKALADQFMRGLYKAGLKPNH